MGELWLNLFSKVMTLGYIRPTMFAPVSDRAQDLTVRSPQLLRKGQKNEIPIRTFHTYFVLGSSTINTCARRGRRHNQLTVFAPVSDRAQDLTVRSPLFLRQDQKIEIPMRPFHTHFVLRSSTVNACARRGRRHNQRDDGTIN